MKQGLLNGASVTNCESTEICKAKYFVKNLPACIL